MYEQSRGAFPLAWISLDSEDNDPVRFLAYLAAASGQLQADLGTEKDRPPALS